jgi:hypothetical protein
MKVRHIHYIFYKTKVGRFNVHARPGAAAVSKEINPLLLKTYLVDTTS